MTGEGPSEGLDCAGGDWSLHCANGLTLTVTQSADSAVFERFFAGYDDAFVLADEKETRDGFKVCLDLNHGPAYAGLAGRFGPFREICLTAKDAAGMEIGGANFIAMPDGDRVTANLNYVYTSELARGKKYFRPLLDAIRQLVGGLFPGVPKVLIFIEQNDPLAMSEEDDRLDTKAAGLEQWERLRVWAHAGARVVDFAYVQPPLSETQQPDATLVYSVIGEGAPMLSACTLAKHLTRFFAISVLKAGDPDKAPTAKTQIEKLSGFCASGVRIPLLDPRPWLDPLKTRDDFKRQFRDAATFRDALRGLIHP
jgi:hypothetical protein